MAQVAALALYAAVQLGSASPSSLPAQLQPCPPPVLGAAAALLLLLLYVTRLRAGFRPWLIHQLVEYRAVVLVCFACPMSVLLWLFTTARNRFAEATANPADHDRRVAAVCAQVRTPTLPARRWLSAHTPQQESAGARQVEAWAASPASSRRPMCTARASWQNLSTRFVNKDVLHKIQLAHLRDVLSINAEPGEKGTVLVEPNVSVGQVGPRCPYTLHWPCSEDVHVSRLRHRCCDRSRRRTCSRCASSWRTQPSAAWQWASS